MTERDDALGSRLEGWIEARRHAVDEELERRLPRPPACPAVIAAAMRYSVQAGGKRLRPLLVLAAAEASGAMAHPPLTPDDACGRAVPAACAIEFIHTYSLVHDDLPAMDNDVLRRGIPTLHVVQGEGMAILGGDGLLTEAFAVLARGSDGSDPADPARTIRVIARVAAAAGAAGMVGGQAIDLHLAGQGPKDGAPAPVPDLAVLRDMHARKTGALIRAAATCGAMAVGASDAIVQAVDEYATEVGLAFQIVDDILDVEGSLETLGKTAGSDQRKQKITYPGVHGLPASKARAAVLVREAHVALAPLGAPAEPLRALADFILQRKA